MIKSSMVKRTLSMPSTLESIKKASEEILKALEPFTIDDKVLFNIRLCVEEAVRNAVVHGNCLNKKLPVEITYVITGKRLQVEIEDKGEGFDREKIPDCTADENLLRESGRGVFLINRLMDEVRYNERGNIVKMIKFLSGGNDGAENGK